MNGGSALLTFAGMLDKRKFRSGMPNLREILSRIRTRLGQEFKAMNRE
jgi:hypothetical protein